MSNKFYRAASGEVRSGECPADGIPLREYKTRDGLIVYRDMSALDSDRFANSALGTNFGTFIGGKSYCLSTEVAPTDLDHVDVPAALRGTIAAVMKPYSGNGPVHGPGEESAAYAIIAFGGAVIANRSAELAGYNPIYSRSELNELYKRAVDSMRAS